MSDKTVEKLNIQVSADAQRASRALDRLSSSLLGMDKAVKRLNNSGFSKISTTLNSFSNSISKLDGIEIPDLSEAVQSLEKLGNIKVSDNGINKTVNALTRLFRADLSGFNPENFQRITNSISALGNMPDVSSSVNRFVSSLSRLANAGEKTGQSANEVLRLGEQTRLAAQKLKSVGGINEDVNLFVQSIGRLASAGAKTSQTASGLNSLAKETLEFFKAMQNAPKVSENTIRMTQALAQLATAGGKVGTSTNTITSAFNKLSSVGSKTMSVMRKVASGITSAFKQIGNSSSGLTKAQFSLGNLLKTAIGFRLGYGLLNFGKQAFELGSAITEVENVVDVAFGDMADKAYEFASTAKEQFGLSELAAKQYSGTMMAMLNSTGVAQDAAAEMSTTLAGLAGDLASFYNISTDEAFMKLRSAIAGETEPMRQLGINMTVAALQSYALSQGITKSWQSMTQAEQAMLRYNYIMSATSQQQGDYQRTVGSFANQLRLLTLNFQQLAATIGQGFIAAVLPAIQALNALMSVLQRAAEAFRDFMYVLTGYDGKGSQSGIVSELQGMEGASSGLEDVSGSMDDTTDSAKKLKKALSVLPFDQLNQLTDNTQDAGGGGGTGGDDINVPGSGIGNVDSIYDALGSNKLPNAINEWAERIRKAFIEHDWNDLGKEIAWGINKGLQAIYDVINWDNAKKKIIPFINGFTQTFNSLVDAIDWDLLGRTVGAGINTIVNTFNQLLEGIKWKKLGKKLADGVNGLFDEVNWENLGKLLGNSFQAVWDLFGNFVGNLDFAKIGSSVAKGLNGVFSKISFGDIANYLATALNGAFTTLEAFTADFEWDELVENISNGIITFIEEFEWEENAGKLSDFLVNLLGALKDLSAKIPWSELGEKIGTFLGGIDWFGIFGSVFEIIKNVVVGFIDGFGETTAGKFALAFGTALSVSNLMSAIDFEGILVLFEQISSLFDVLGLAIGGISGPAAIALAAITFLAAGLGYVFATNEDVRKSFEEASASIIASLESLVDVVLNSLLTALTTGFQNLMEILSPLGEFLTGAFTSVWQDMIIPTLQYLGETVLPSVTDTFAHLWNEVLVPLGNFLKDVLSPVFEVLSDVLTILWENVVLPLAHAIGHVLSGAWEGIVEILNVTVIPILGTVIKIFQFLWDNVLSPICAFIGSILVPVVKSAFETMGDLTDNLGKILGGLIDFIAGVFTGNWEKAWEGVKNIFSGIWNTLVDVVKTPINMIIGGINALMKGIEGGINIVIGALNSLSFDVPDWVPLIGGETFGFNIKKIKAPQIEYLARGGLVSGPTYAVIGETFQKEAVLPLENKRTMSMIANSILDNASAGMGLSTEEVRQAVTEGVVVAMMNNQQNPINVTVYSELRTESDEVLARAVTRGQNKIDYRTNPTPQFT